MAQITKKGRKLASLLTPSIGTTTAILEACSLICRHTVTCHRVQESYCDGHPAMKDPRISVEQSNRIWERFEKWLDKRDTQLERRITEIVGNLPHTDDGPITVRLAGDPRGCVVTLLLPDGNYNN